MKLNFIVLIFLSLLFSCGNKANEKKTDVYSIRNIGALSTTEYTIGKVVKLQDNQAWYKFGDRRILISCKATIKAGVDLNQISDGDIVVKGNTLTVNLPAVAILSFDMDPNTTHTEVEDINGFRQAFTQQEKNQILVLGEKSIRANLKETKILVTAERNAAIFVKDFYQQLGYEHVVVNFKKQYV